MLQLPLIHASDAPLLYASLQALLWLGANGFLFLLPVAVFAIDRRLGVRLVLVFGLSVVINSLLKNLLALPRPQELGVDAFGFGEFGFPSSHAQLATVFWGMIALHLRHWLVTLLALFMVLATSAAPLLLQLHYPRDIIGGLALGIGTLLLVWRYQQRAESLLLAHGPQARKYSWRQPLPLPLCAGCWLARRAAHVALTGTLTGGIGMTASQPGRTATASRRGRPRDKS